LSTDHSNRARELLLTASLTGMSLPLSGLHGAFLRSEAVKVLGRHQVSAELATGALLSPWRGVLVDAVRGAEPLTIVAAAWLAVGRSALVAGPSAAFLHGLTAVPPTPVHLVVPYETSKRSRSGIVVHNGTSLDVDREERFDLPVLGLDRVLSDLACTLSPWNALAVLDEAFAQTTELDREVLRRRLRDLVGVRPDPRGTRIGTRLIDLATGRAESPPESWLRWRVVDLGFPVPEANLPIHDIDGRELYRLDLGWRELRIALEYNGYAAHAGREAFDEVRRNDVERRGWIVIDADSDDLPTGSRLEKELDEAFRARGLDVRGRTAGALRPRRHRERRSR
jgi:hypothetical protein